MQGINSNNAYGINNNVALRGVQDVIAARILKGLNSDSNGGFSFYNNVGSRAIQEMISTTIFEGLKKSQNPRLGFNTYNVGPKELKESIRASIEDGFEEANPLAAAGDPETAIKVVIDSALANPYIPPRKKHALAKAVDSVFQKIVYKGRGGN